MKKSLGLLSVLFVFFVGVAVTHAEDHKYVKSKKCKMCHRIEYKSWAKTKMANAYKNLMALKPEEVKALGEKVGIKNADVKKDCIKCHVTGYNEKDGSYSEEGLTCEACHHPGSDYAKMNVMKDIDEAIENGLNIPTEKDCLKCHNKKSPMYKPFKFKERRLKVHEFKIPPKWAPKKEEGKKDSGKEEKK